MNLAKIRAKIDLENARTTVAPVRALRNGAELMKNNKNIKFIKYLETIYKIAAQGKHRFVLDPTGVITTSQPKREG